MKRLISAFVALAFALLVPLQIASAEYKWIPYKALYSAEKAQVIKFDNDKNDTIVKLLNGETRLIQHTRICNSMSQDFPVDLIRDKNGNVYQMKVDFNEICKVRNDLPFTDEIKILELIKPENPLIRIHQARIDYNGLEYEISYSKGCEYLRDYVNDWAYVYLPKGQLAGGQLYMSTDRGQCRIRSADYVGILGEDEEHVSPPIGLQYEPRDNSVFFYWHKEEDKKNLYLVSYSKLELDTDLYRWRQMPNLIITKDNTITVKGLKSGVPHYFYIAKLDEQRRLSKWIAKTIVPAKGPVFSNNYREDPFEIQLMEDNEEEYVLQWPQKENVKKYRVIFYMNGKRERIWFVAKNKNEIRIPKKLEYRNQNFRLTVEGIMTSSYIPRYKDGFYWEDQWPDFND